MASGAMVARHQGIVGLGLFLTVGAGVALASSLVLLPILLGLVDRGHSRAAEREQVGARP